MASFPYHVKTVIYGVSTTSTSTSTSGSSTSSTGSTTTSTTPPTPKAASGSYYRCDVFLPLSFFNKSDNVNTNSFGQSCPTTNITPPTVTDGVITNNLTLFGSDLLDLVLNTFNERYGTQLTTEQFSIKSTDNDQNSTCGYEVYSTKFQIFISAYVQLANQISTNILFIDGIAA